MRRRKSHASKKGSITRNSGKTSKKCSLESVQGGVFILENGCRSHLVFKRFGIDQKGSDKRMKVGEARVGSNNKIWEKIMKIRMACSLGDEKRKLLKMEHWRMVQN